MIGKSISLKISNHIVDVHDMVEIGSGAKRAVDDVKLSRYAFYLIVQNADPSKEIVAIGQTYFAVQTRLQEIQQMDDYNLLKTEEDKRLFLRNFIQIIRFPKEYEKSLFLQHAFTKLSWEYNNLN